MEMKKIYYCLGGVALSIALVACGNDAQKTGQSAPSGASQQAVEAPVAMFLVYCSCPGLSAMMKRRAGVEK